MSQGRPLSQAITIDRFHCPELWRDTPNTPSKIHSTAKVMAFQKSAANIKQIARCLEAPHDFHFPILCFLPFGFFHLGLNIRPKFARS